ncbi:MAG: type II and III secretion system protein, partial [Betaproteobacteria bacterium]|nr:type II and III secretion system protein [Betaproteobacteria bacterium]
MPTYLNHGPSLAAVAAIATLAAGCGTQPVAQPDAHIRQDPARAAAAPEIPKPVIPAPLPPPPEARAAEVKYSIVVANQPVRDVLLAIAAETKVNVDVHPGVEGLVTLNAIDQTLKQILTRLSKQVDMRYEIESDTIHVMPDSPYLRNYRVDYVNMARETSETVSVATQILSGAVAGTTGASQSGDNNSTLRISNTSRHRFWETLERNIKDMLRETDKLLPEGSSETFVSGRGQSGVSTTQSSLQRRAVAGTGAVGNVAGAVGATATSPGQTVAQQAGEYVEQRLTFREAASVIVNPEAGIVTVRATSRQHEKVAEFLEQVTGSARRQVVIEATVVEVQLNDSYQSGVDWSALATNGLGYSITQSFIQPALASAANVFSLTYANPNPAAGGNISSTIKLLNTYGTTKVLSSPVLMVLNNQTAVLRVTENLVYFTIKADTNTNANVSTTTFTTTQNVLPVGIIMNLTAQISDNDVVTLNVRPTVTAKIGEVQDPNPSLRGTLTTPSIESKIPVTQTREMESVLRVASGQTAILGGLMVDSFQNTRGGLPILSRIPIFGDLVSYRDDAAKKRELVIFMRPVVVRNASIEGDLAGYRRFLPNTRFFKDAELPLPAVQETVRSMAPGEEFKFTTTPNPVVAAPPPPGGPPWADT